MTKQPWDWTEDDILGLIRDDVKESLNLDYKRCDSLAKKDDKRRELSKDISAFANSAGGTIVYGVVENGESPINIDVGYEPREISREWIENVIMTNIQPRIDGIRINQIDLKTHNPGRVIYAVHVPQSKRTPHMAADKRYYRRYEFQSVPMEDYEVKDLFRRHDSPNLYANFNYNPVVNDLNGYFSRNMTVTIINESSEPAFYAIFRLFVDKRIFCGVPTTGATLSLKNEDGADYWLDGQLFKTVQFQTNIGTGNTLPIWSDVGFDIYSSPLRLNFPRNLVESDTSFAIGWRIDSPKMTPKEEFHLVRPSNEGFFIKLLY